MNNSKVHSQRTVPFSWENKPGVSKDSKDDLHHHYTTSTGDHDQGEFPSIKLPPPPCPPEKSRASFGSDLQIPPPPCPNFQQPLRSSSRRSFRKNDDPFLLAYKECTKSNRKKDHKGLKGVMNRIDGGLGLRKNLSVFSCKQRSGNFTDDSIVRVSQPPVSKSQRESVEE